MTDSNTRSQLPASLAQRKVGELMISAPQTHSIDTAVGAVRATFEDSHLHMVLLTHGRVLYGTLLRSDLQPDVPPAAAALLLATLDGRTVQPDRCIQAVHERMVQLGQRRLAVVDPDNKLLGLLCLKRDQTGFCTDQGVAARRSNRSSAT